jgi:O-antigen ligase
MLNGFFLYLALLAAIGVRPRTALTFVCYLFFGALALTAAYQNRSLLLARLRSQAAPVKVSLFAATLLAVWFVLNVLLLARTELALHFAGLLVLWSLPSAILAASLPPARIVDTTRAMVVLGGIYLTIEAVAVANSSGQNVRFTPIAKLDPISAGQIPAVASVALLALRPRSLRGRLAQAFGLVAFTAGALIPGSRGPILALVGGCVVAAFVDLRRLWPIVLTGLVLGALVATPFTRTYLKNSIPGIHHTRDPTTTARPISTFQIRREWLKAALAKASERPLFGHGVAQFVDNTPEAHRMGVAGTRTYPHNSFAEAAFSLGLLGLLPFVALFVVITWALVSLIRHARAPPTFVAGLTAFAFVAANFSGEIGADAMVWAAGALVIALYADAVRLPPRASSARGV